MFKMVTVPFGSRLVMPDWRICWRAWTTKLADSGCDTRPWGADPVCFCTPAGGPFGDQSVIHRPICLDSVCLGPGRFRTKPGELCYGSLAPPLHLNTITHLSFSLTLYLTLSLLFLSLETTSWLVFGEEEAWKSLEKGKEKEKEKQKKAWELDFCERYDEFYGFWFRFWLKSSKIEIIRNPTRF